MNKFMLNIKIRYDTFSKSEKKIADVLLQKPDNVLSLYISDFAKVCKTSEATIVRFAKHLGFDGYQQFKIAIAQEAKTHPINERIKYDDSAAEIFQKVRILVCRLHAVLFGAVIADLFQFSHHSVFGNIEYSVKM